jgi:hypothetical protein
VRTANVSFPASPGGTGGYQQNFAACLAGETVLGGGFDLPAVGVGGDSNFTAIESRPGSATGAVLGAGQQPRSWFVEARQNDTDSAATVHVWVLCGKG